LITANAIITIVANALGNIPMDGGARANSLRQRQRRNPLTRVQLSPASPQRGKLPKLMDPSRALRVSNAESVRACAKTGVCIDSAAKRVRQKLEFIQESSQKPSRLPIWVCTVQMGRQTNRILLLLSCLPPE
jgi:hypothetical protein